MHKLSGSQYHFNYIMLSTALHKTYCFYTTHIFKNDLLPTTAVQQRQHVDEVRCHMFFSELINKSWIICEFLVGTSISVGGAAHPIAPSGYGPGYTFNEV